MNIKEKLSSDLKEAMKRGDSTAVGVLRLLISVLNNKSIEKRSKGQAEQLTDEETMWVLMTEAKKRRESIDIFTKGGRADLADKEKAELEILKQYLPKQMSREEVERSVETILEKLESKEIGLAMKEVMKELRGKADSAMISEVVKQKLQ